MITIYRSTDAGLEKVERPAKGCWIDAVDPDADAESKLVGELNIPPDFLRDSLDPDQVSLVEKEDGVLLILVRVPQRNDSAASLPYVTVPLGIVMTGDTVVTICRTDHGLLRDLLREHESDLDPAQPSRFVLHLLWSVANGYLRRLAEIEKIVEALEDRLERSLENREVLEILRYQKSLVHFETALRGNQLVLERLRDNEFLKSGRKDEDLLEDVLLESRQAMEQVEITSNILGQMMGAFASIISNNVNTVVKFLTSITVIMMVPTLLGTFYGMNVRLPLEDHPSAFVMTVGLSFLCSLVVGLFFWKKGWL